jgi:site-specific recombinase XerC
MVLWEAIRDYGQYARHERGQTTTTFYSYRTWQRNFVRNLRPRTLRGALHGLRALFAYVVEMTVLDANPATDIRMPKKDAATRLLVGDGELVELLDAAEHFPA